MFRSLLRIARGCAVAGVGCVALSGCLSTKMYVAPELQTVGKTNLHAVSEPHPVQVLFEFQTKGVPNTQATGSIKPRAVAAAAESGLFSKVSTDSLGPDAGILQITINNISLTNNAAAKGFGTGLTLGLAGSMVEDGYICTATYSRHGKTTQAIVKDAIYTTVGNHSAPLGLRPMNPQSAVNLTMDRLIWNALKQLDAKHAF